MVDIHCHILPGIDDGSWNWEMTAEMCRMATADGISHIVATPHCNHDFDYNRERYTEMLALLSDAGQGRIRFSLGCDFHFTDASLIDLLQNPRRFTIGDTRYLLVEFHHAKLAANVSEQLEQVISHGLVPIITHPERNLFLLKRQEMVLDFVKQGCLVQVTANAFTGFWGPKPKKMAEWLLQEGAIHVIASDAHEPERRTPILSEARDVICELANEKVAEALVTGNPSAIVAGRSLPKQTLPAAGASHR